MRLHTTPPRGPPRRKTAQRSTRRIHSTTPPRWRSSPWQGWPNFTH